jgi:hypothetical protein
MLRTHFEAWVVDEHRYFDGLESLVVAARPKISHRATAVPATSAIRLERDSFFQGYIAGVLK